MQITKYVHAIKIPFQITIGPGKTVDRFVYLYLIYGKKIYLIDSGVASSEKAIFEYIRKTGRNPDDISMIILTHSHPDHIGAAKAIKEASSCTVAAHQAEKSWIENVEQQSKERPVPNFNSLVGGSVAVDHILKEGDILDMDGELKLEVFHTPGHSKGSISLLLQEDKALFCGDAIPIAGDLPIYEDFLASVKSIKKLKGIEGIKVLLASWDNPQKDNKAYQVMVDGLSYLQHIHNAVIKITDKHFSLESFELYKLFMEELGLSNMAVNPLVARSFESNLKIRDSRDCMTLNIF